MKVLLFCVYNRFMDNILISIKDLEKTYKEQNSFLSPKKPPLHVLKGINLDIIKGEIRHYEDKNVLYDKDALKEIRKAYLKALAREKYNLYKTNFDLGN